jgi:hypothetical protein
VENSVQYSLGISPCFYPVGFVEESCSNHQFRYKAAFNADHLDKGVRATLACEPGILDYQLKRMPKPNKGDLTGKSLTKTHMDVQFWTKRGHFAI